LGGILGNQPNQIIRALKKFGTLLGTAFQIQDDLLEITANEDDMGKSLGSDLTNGKQTILSILARQKNALEWKKLNSIMGNISDSIKEQKQFFKTNGIFEEVENMIRSFINNAKETLNSIPDPCRTKLNQFTKLILERDH
jgi:geranylgeranyl pyrophosphate synthase